jgi:hypothetical protein
MPQVVCGKVFPLAGAAAGAPQCALLFGNMWRGGNVRTNQSAPLAAVTIGRIAANALPNARKAGSTQVDRFFLDAEFFEDFNEQQQQPHRYQDHRIAWHIVKQKVFGSLA